MARLGNTVALMKSVTRLSVPGHHCTTHHGGKGWVFVLDSNPTRKGDPYFPFGLVRLSHLAPYSARTACLEVDEDQELLASGLDKAEPHVPGYPKSKLL